MNTDTTIARQLGRQLGLQITNQPTTQNTTTRIATITQTHNTTVDITIDGTKLTNIQATPETITANPGDRCLITIQGALAIATHLLPPATGASRWTTLQPNDASWKQNNPPLAIRKDGGMVTLDGSISRTGGFQTGYVCATIPAGYRPDRQTKTPNHYFSSQWWVIGTDGTIRCEQGNDGSNNPIYLHTTWYTA